MSSKADFFFEKADKWQESVLLLRNLLLDTGLVETLKWGCPCYLYEEKNIVLIHTFKDYCALLFFKGALMPDPKGLLVQQTANVQSARQIRFTSTAEIKKQKTAIKAYVLEAVKVEESGQKVAFSQKHELEFPEELQQAFDRDPALKTAFEALTPGRQRAYNLHFTQAKQSATRISRIEKSRERILAGKGLND